MKLSLETHRQHYANRETHVSQIKIDISRQQAQYDRRIQELCLFRAQIDLAEKEGKDGFDEERYAIKRLCV